MPRQAPYSWRIVQTATHAFFLFEGNIHSYRQIFPDGRKHPDDPDPTWYGHPLHNRVAERARVVTNPIVARHKGHELRRFA